MRSALIGSSGFIGTALRKQTEFSVGVDSKTIGRLHRGHFDQIVCAGAPAQKWLANLEPERDRENIETLISNLELMSCERFVLVSTVDVFSNPVDVWEDTRVDEVHLGPYGLHRRALEQYVVRRFSNVLIVRLPGVVGPGLKKNVLFDFLNRNNLDAIDSRGVFQFYPIVNLWSDIATAVSAGLTLVHLTAAPVIVSEVARLCFGMEFLNIRGTVPSNYDMRSRFAEMFGGSCHYQYSGRESMLAIRAYAQSESRTSIPRKGAGE